MGWLPVSGTTGSAVGARDEAAAPRRQRALQSTPAALAIAAATVLGLGLRVYQLARPGQLLSVAWYDDGVYYASALRLTDGVLPYRDFIFAQPPGITLLMTPAALLAKVVGTDWGMAVGRLLTLLASTASVVLAGLLVRHRGLLAVVVTCGVLAVYPGSVTTTYTIFLEPWVVLFCLVAALAVFDRDRLAGGRRIVWGGLAFGFAGAIESWAILPVLVVVLLSLATPAKTVRLVAGVAAGFLVPVLPFAALSPRRFYESVFIAQLVRYGQPRVPVWARLNDLTGLNALHGLGHTTVLVTALTLAGFVLATAVAAAARHGPPPPLEWFALLTMALIVIAFMWPPGFFFHFPAFLAPFLALSLSLPISRLLPGGDRARAGPGWLATAVACVLIGVFAVIQAGSENALVPRVGPAALAAARRAIPPGACVFTDQVSFTIAADRFSSSAPGCSEMIDPLGTDYALTPGRDGLNGAGRFPAVVAMMRQAFGHAQFVWLAGRYNLRRIAWSPSLRAYFASHFTRVLTDAKGDALYVRHGVHPR